jgi:hypothetical protein
VDRFPIFQFLTLLCWLTLLPDPARAQTESAREVDLKVGESITWSGCEVTRHAEPPYIRVQKNGQAHFATPSRTDSASYYMVILCDLGGSPDQELVLLADYGGTYPRHDLAILDGETQDLWYQGEELAWARVEDLTGDGRYDVALADDKVGPFKGYPTLLFRVGPEGLTLAPELMGQRPLDSVLGNYEKAEQGAWPDSVVGHYNWEVALIEDLIYSGRAQMAWEFFERESPWSGEAKTAYWDEILTDLQKSPFWRQIRQLNRSAQGNRDVRGFE